LLILNWCFPQIEVTNYDGFRLGNSCEFWNGKIIIIGGSSDESSQKQSGKILMLDQQGNLLTQRTYTENDGNLYFVKAFFKEERFYVFSILSRQTESKLVLYQLDTDLNILETNYYTTPLDHSISMMNVMFDSDSLFVISGYTSLTSYSSRMFFYKINLDGDSVLLKYSDQTYQLAYQLHESSDSSKYLLFLDGFYPAFGYSGLLQLSKTFDVLEFNYIMPHLNKTYASISYQDSLFLTTGITMDQFILKLMKVNWSGNVLSSSTYFKEIGMKEVPAINSGIVQSGSDYYFGSTTNIDYHTPDFSSQDSWFHLVKVNQDLETIWEKWYGGDAYYTLRNLLATSDGGCLMVGFKYPHGVDDLIIRGHYIKVDANGNEVWTADVEISEWSYKVYPNPTQSVFNIENNEMDIHSVELFDISGKLLNSVQDCNNTTNSVDLSYFSPGVYLAKIKSSKGIRTEKVVKN
jgi:hypothetical protein